MKKFMMIFRKEKESTIPSPEQMQEGIKQWQHWIGGIVAQERFVATDALGFQGKLINADGMITDGPYTEVKEIIGGYIVVKAESLDEAVSLADGCPIFNIGGTVEVRDIMDIPKG